LLFVTGDWHVHERIWNSRRAAGKLAGLNYEGAEAKGRRATLMAADLH
jgi:hypothetical protein